MIANSCRSMKLHALVATLLAGLVAASCAPMSTAPQQVQASHPNVTYKYRSDKELVQANQSAAEFCDRYRAVPQTTSFANDPDGSKVVVFDCVQTSSSAMSPQFNSNLVHNYRSDQELLDASRNAQIYCASNGARQVTSNIVSNPNGTKTVTFQCRPR